MQTSTNHNSFLSTRRGKLTLALVCLAGFLDFVDTTIVNVALPSIRHGLGFSVANLQWVISGYLLTYGGLLLLGGRAADLLGRRRLLVTGTTLFALSSLAGGLANSDSVMIAARLAQGLGAAMMTPAALSILTTSFSEGSDRIKALGIWSATVPLASALGVTLGGVLSQGPGWRAVFLVNVPVAVVVIVGAMRLLDDDGKRAAGREFDLPGAALGTGALLLLVYALVNASHVGWGTTRTIAELTLAGILLVAFVVTEQRHRTPLVPFSIFRIEGLAAADATQVIAQAGFLSMFFFITLYMQNVLGFSPIAAGTAYRSHRRRRHRSRHLDRTGGANRHPPDHRRRGRHRSRRRLLALTNPRSRVLPDRPAPRTRRHGARTRGGHGRRAERRERRRPGRQGGPRSRAHHDVIDGRSGARPRDPDSDRDQPDESPHRRPRERCTSPHRRVPLGAGRLQRLPGRRGSHRRPRHQHPRRASDRRRTRRSARADSRSRVTVHPRGIRCLTRRPPEHVGPGLAQERRSAGGRRPGVIRATPQHALPDGRKCFANDTAASPSTNPRRSKLRKIIEYTTVSVDGVFAGPRTSEFMTYPR